MSTKEALYITLMQTAGWAVAFRHAEDTGSWWWEASHPQGEKPIVGMSVEGLWEAWLDTPLVISDILGVRIVGYVNKK